MITERNNFHRFLSPEAPLSNEVDTCLSSDGYLDSGIVSFSEPRVPLMNLRYGQHHNCSENINSRGRYDYEENYVPIKALRALARSNQFDKLHAQQNFDESRALSNFYQGRLYARQVNGHEQTRYENGYLHPNFWRYSAGISAPFRDHVYTNTTYCNYDTASGDSDMRLCQPSRYDHLSKMKFGKRKNAKRFSAIAGNGEARKKKRYRPLAAVRERERLVVMNAALKKLRMCLPLQNQEQKLSKKEILLSAAVYIKHLSDELSEPQEGLTEENGGTVNLNNYDYVLAES